MERSIPQQPESVVVVPDSVYTAYARLKARQREANEAVYESLQRCYDAGYEDAIRLPPMAEDNGVFEPKTASGRWGRFLLWVAKVVWTWAK